jgi:hypothetical protein
MQISARSCKKRQAISSSGCFGLKKQVLWGLWVKKTRIVPFVGFGRVARDIPY